MLLLQGGFDMICSGRDKIETPEQVKRFFLNVEAFIYQWTKLASVWYTLQFQQAEDTVTKLDLDGLVVIGGDDSNTNACLLAEHFRLQLLVQFSLFCILVIGIFLPSLFRGKNMKTLVIGCPKTIDGDLKSKEVPTSFGFDTACKVSKFKMYIENCITYVFY